jgi:hypothetical protein
VVIPLFLKNAFRQHSYLKEIEGLGEKHIGVFFDGRLHDRVDDPGRHHDDFCLGGNFLDLFKYGNSINIRQANVQKAEIVRRSSNFPQRFFSRFHYRYFGGGGPQRIAQPMQKECFIINNKDLLHTHNTLPITSESFEFLLKPA